MSFAAYSLQVPASHLLETLTEAPERFEQAWLAGAAGREAASLQGGLAFLCHQADSELGFGLKLRGVEPRAWLSWRSLAEGLPLERRDLAARAALEGFARLRRWNLDYCESHTLTLHHFGVLNAVAQQDALRLEQLKTVLSAA